MLGDLMTYFGPGSLNAASWRSCEPMYGNGFVRVIKNGAWALSYSAERVGASDQCLVPLLVALLCRS